MKLYHKISELRRSMPSETAQSILMQVLDMTLTELYEIDLFNELQLMQIDKAVEAYHKSIPISRVLNRKFFWRDLFHISPFTLDPRPETELVVEYAVKANPKSILDIGTGTGCILLSILRELPSSTGVGSDISTQALDVAKYNAANLDIDARFILSDFYTNIQGEFDLIVSNPPYIKRECSYEAMFDPPAALWDDDSYNQLITTKHLKPKGSIILEVPEYSLNLVRDLSAKAQLNYKICEKIGEIYICWLSTH